MIIDCAGCVMRDVACGDCVVTFLLGPAEGLEPAEQTALGVLADGGLIPPLRMLPVVSAAVAESAGGTMPREPGSRPPAARPAATRRRGAASA